MACTAWGNLQLSQREHALGACGSRAAQETGDGRRHAIFNDVLLLSRRLWGARAAVEYRVPFEELLACGTIELQGSVSTKHYWHATPCRMSCEL